MDAKTRRDIAALNYEIFALAVAIELLNKRRPDCAAILAKCEGSVRRCQMIIASLGARSDGGSSVTIQ